MADRYDANIDAFWDRRNGQAGSTPVIDAELAATIQQLHLLYASSPPSSTRERVRQRVLDPSSVTTENAPPMNALALPVSTPARPSPRAAEPATLSRRSLWIALAAAAVLLFGSLGGWLTYDRLGSEPSHPAVIPAVQEATPTPETSDWPMYRGNPGRTGAMPGTGPKTAPGVVWSAALDGSSYRSPIVVGDTAYVGTASGTLYALDATTGEQRWTFKADDGLEITPAYQDGIVFVPSLSGTLFAVDAASGIELWRFGKPLAAFATPTFGDGLLFAGSETDNALYGIDPKTGTEVWHYDTASEATRGQSYADGVVYSGSEDGTLYAIKATDGSLIWQSASLGGHGTPAVADGVLYTANADGQLLMFDTATGDELGRIDTGSEVGITPPTIGDSLVFFGTHANAINAVDPTTQQVIWSYPTHESIQAAVALVDGVIYAASLDGTIFALDAATGAELWTYKVEGVTDFGPTVAHGLLFVSTSTGLIEALGEGGDTAATPASVVEAAASPVSSDASGAPQASFVWEVTSAGSSLLGQPVPALGPDGNIHVADGEIQQMLVFSPDGDLIDKWGDPGSGPGQIGYPQSLGFDAEGNTFVFDTDNTRVMKFAPDHTLLTEWGTVGTENGQFGYQVEGTVDPVNELVYVADFDNNRIQVFDLDGNFVDKWGNMGTGEGGLYHPVTIALGPDGLIYVGEAANGSGSRVQIFNSAGTYKGTLSNPDGTQAQFSEAWGIAFDSAGNIYVSDYWAHAIRVFDPNRVEIGTIQDVPGAGPFRYPERIVIDADDNLYVTDWEHGRLVKLALDLAA